jgi:hypothetical protein
MAKGSLIPINDVGPTEVDNSILAWMTNTHSVLHSPVTILSVVGLLVIGVFSEIAPRKSLEFLDNIFGSLLFFISPFVFAILLDWPTGLLAAVVSLIVFARLQKQDYTEGFSDALDGTEQSTKIISNPHRWFIEKMMGERPLAISSDRVITTSVQDNYTNKSISPHNSTNGASFTSHFNSSSSNK